MADLFGERSEFRRGHPDIATDEGMQTTGYQMLKMGDIPASIALLTANTADNPKSSDAAFGLGRAYREAKELEKARASFENALKLDPKNKRASDALAALASDSAARK